MGETVRIVPARCRCSEGVEPCCERFCELKKLEEAEEPSRKRKGRGSESEGESAVTLNDVILAGTERGLTMTDIRRMQLGQVVDYIVDFNERQKRADKQAKVEEKRGKKRKATQNDINSWFG